MKMRLNGFIQIVIFVMLISLSACGRGTEDLEEQTSPADDQGDGTSELNIPLPEEDHEINVTVLYTSDEHGWMEGQEEGQGAAELLGLWEENHGYSVDDDSFLVLSGGDMWTGPAISTWFEGSSMIEIMNAIGYDAAAVGNHEFDFGLPALQTNAELMAFPMLAANVTYHGSSPEELGIQSTAIFEVSGVKVGVVGLSNELTPRVTNPSVVADVDFGNYENALRESVPLLRARGADIIILVSHLCEYELIPLAKAVSDLQIAAMGGGHCHYGFANTAGSSILIGSHPNLVGYAYAMFSVDTESNMVYYGDYGSEFNKNGKPDEEIVEMVAAWRNEADEELAIVIGYSEDGIMQRSDEMESLIVETWLITYPQADISMTNPGGIRADIPAGEITLADVIGVMPFDNTIVLLELTGSDFVKVMKPHVRSTVVGGATYSNGNWYLDDSGEKLDPDETYQVLVNSFMYAGGDDYRFYDYDWAGYDTSTDWRTPVIDWMIDQDSSKSEPIDDAVENLMNQDQ